MFAFFWHIEKTHGAIWSWVNFVGILLGVENNSVQNEMLTLFPKLLTRLVMVWRASQPNHQKLMSIGNG
jgi:hypothetical protein